MAFLQRLRKVENKAGKMRYPAGPQGIFEPGNRCAFSSSARIDFAQAWALSHGNVWRLIGVWVLVTMLAVTAYGLLEQTIFAVQKVTRRR